MSIPGAHDACTAGVDDIYIWYRTQVLGIGELFDGGVRAFDVRPSARGGRLGVFHEVADTHTSFEEVVDVLSGRLDEHPGEFAIIVFRHEKESDTSDNFEELVGAFLHSEAVSDLSVDFREDLTLGDVRGKILFISRQEYVDGPVGAYVKDWDDYQFYDENRCAWLVSASDTNTRLMLQDHYSPVSKDDKLSAVFDLMDHVAKKDVWTINHCSAYMSESKSYGENAQNVNAEVAGHISALDGHAGVVMLDFACVDEYRGPANAKLPVRMSDFKVNGKILVDTIIEKNNYQSTNNQSSL